MKKTDELYRCSPKSLWRDSTADYMQNKIDKSQEIILLEFKKPLICRDYLFIMLHKTAKAFWQALLDREH